MPLGKRKQDDDDDDWSGVVSVDPDAIEFALPPAATESLSGIRMADFKVKHAKDSGHLWATAEVEVTPPCFGR